MSVEALFGNEQQGIDNVAITAPGTSLLANGSFETDGDGDGAPDAWVARALRPVDGDGVVCDTALSGACSIRLGAGGRANRLVQDVAEGGFAGDRFRLCLADKASSVGGTGRYRALIRFAHTDGTKRVKRLDLPEGDHDWTRQVLEVVATKDYESVRVKLVFGKSEGTVWLDEVMLLRLDP